MEIWYRVNRHAWRDQQFVEAVEVVRSTEKSVWINNRRTAPARNDIRSSYSNYFKTFSEAKEFAINRQQERINTIAGELDRAEIDMLKILKQEA